MDSDFGLRRGPGFNLVAQQAFLRDLSPRIELFTKFSIFSQQCSKMHLPDREIIVIIYVKVLESFNVLHLSPLTAFLISSSEYIRYFSTLNRQAGNGKKQPSLLVIRRWAVGIMVVVLQWLSGVLV